MSKHVEIGRLLPAWERFREIADIGPIRDESHYLRMVATLEALLDEAAGDEQHPAMGLIDIVGDLIDDYEARESPLPDATGVNALAFLMEQHGLTVADLPEIGDPAQVQGVLAQRLELDVRQLRALSQRFGVSPGTFM